MPILVPGLSLSPINSITAAAKRTTARTLANRNIISPCRTINHRAGAQAKQAGWLELGSNEVASPSGCIERGHRDQSLRCRIRSHPTPQRQGQPGEALRRGETARCPWRGGHQPAPRQSALHGGVHAGTQPGARAPDANMVARLQRRPEACRGLGAPLARRIAPAHPPPRWAPRSARCAPPLSAGASCAACSTPRGRNTA